MRPMSEPAASAAEPDLPPSAGLARNAIYLVMGQVATTTLAILFNGAVGRLLGPTDFGLYFLISTFAAFAYVVVDWGQQFYGLREVARAPHRAGELLGTGLVLRTLGTVAICLPAGLTAWGLGYDLRTRWFTVAVIALSLPQLLAQYYGIVFRGRDRMGLDAAVSVVNKTAGLALTLPALYLGLGLGGVVVAQGLAGAAALAVAARLYRRVAAGRVVFSRQTAREMLVGGSALVTMSLAIWVQPYIDAVLLSKLVPRDAVGWFGAAKNVMGTLFAPAFIVGAASFPRLSRAAGDPASFARELQTAIRPMFWLGGLAGVGTYLFADTAIALVYGHRHFAPAGDILKVFGPGLFLIFIDVLFGNALTALGRSGAFSAAKVASVVLSTALDLALIPYFQRTSGNGGIGAVLAFVLSEAVIFAGCLYLMPRGSLGARVFLDGGRAIATASLTAALFGLLPMLSPWFGIPLCVIAFTALSLALGLVKRADVDMLRALVKDRLARGSAAVESKS
jgi:O-antigen/teichoic acid export membrane protein